MARHPIPTTICIALYLLTVVGDGEGRLISPGPRRSAAMPTLALPFTLVFVPIVGLDRPLRGLMTVSQQAMADLHAKMAGQP